MAARDVRLVASPAGDRYKTEDCMVHPDGDRLDTRQMATADRGTDAVCLILALDSPPGLAIARELFADLPDLPLSPRGHANDFASARVPTVRTRELLTRHGGRAGAAIAVTLTVESLDTIVDVDRDEITLHAYTASRRLFWQREALAQTARGCGPPFQFSYRLVDGAEVTVAAPSYADGLLVGVVDARGVLDSERREFAPLDDSGLAALLQKHFQDEPGNVARAIEALRTVAGNREVWRHTVLWSCLELRGLAKQVDRELTGD
jgi:hypothetical protein